MKNVKVKQDPENEVTVEVIAASIVSISEGMKKMKSGRLNERAIELLIQHACPVARYNQKPSLGDIRSVLEGIEALEETYLKKKEGK